MQRSNLAKVKIFVRENNHFLDVNINTNRIQTGEAGQKSIIYIYKKTCNALE